MKKLLAGLFLLGSVLAFAAGEQRVPIEKKYASGKVEATMEFKDGKLDGKTLVYNEKGLSKKYYPSGKLLSEVTFKNGQEVKATK